MIILDDSNIIDSFTLIMSDDKEHEKEWKKTEQEEMKEEQHELDLKANYESDEEFEESED